MSAELTPKHSMAYLNYYGIKIIITNTKMYMEHLNLYKQHLDPLLTISDYYISMVYVNIIHISLSLFNIYGCIFM